jgi:hypothetical protein
LGQRWQQHGLNAKLSEWTKLASIALIQVPSSVEEEWLFSKLAYIRNDWRNRLEEEHLNVCLLLATQSFWGLQQFPLALAVQKWQQAKKRRSAPYAQLQQPRDWPMSTSDSD